LRMRAGKPARRGIVAAHARAPPRCGARWFSGP
jgi:hypothetical protein